MTEQIMSIVKSVLNEYDFRKEEAKPGYDAESFDKVASTALANRLISEGYKAKVIKGTLKIDLTEESVNCEEGDEWMYLYPAHYWVEVDKKVIDLTASRFNANLLVEYSDPIAYGSYKELDRYCTLTRKKIR